MKISHVNGIHADRLIGSEEFPKSSNKSDNANCVKQIYSTHMKLFFTQEDFTFRTQFKVTLWRLTTLNPYTPRVRYGGIKVILTLSLWMKSYGVTIQMKPLQQFFHMILMVFTEVFYRMKFGICPEF